MSETANRHRRVVVGVDGSAGSRAALEWAAGKAAVLGRIQPIASVTPAFHGQGSKYKADLDACLRSVDRSLATTLDPDVPIVLAGTSRIVTAFRRRSRHRVFVDGSIKGNVSHPSTAALHERALSLALSGELD